MVASVWSVCTFLSSSLVYLTFLSLERAADCLLARILQNNHSLSSTQTIKSNKIFNYNPNKKLLSQSRLVTPIQNKKRSTLVLVRYHYRTSYNDKTVAYTTYPPKNIIIVLDSSHKLASNENKEKFSKQKVLFCVFIINK